MSTRDPRSTVAQAREEFLAVVARVRPELHRYLARLTGSVIEAEDLVQETLARAFYALPLQPETPALRPWLFRIAHNAALDWLKSHGHKLTEVRDDLDEVVAGELEPPDPLAVRAALSRFLALPVIQRSAVILKDVLGDTLETTAETMGTTVLAVKAALVRGRARLTAALPLVRPTATFDRAALERYAALFNAHDWDGVRALCSDECRLDLVSRSRRRGKEVGLYFDRYAGEEVSLRVVELDGRLVLAAHAGGAARPSYLIALTVTGGRIEEIRDFRYVEYVLAEADLAGL